MVTTCVALMLRGGLSDQSNDIEKIIEKSLEISKTFTIHAQELEFYVNCESWEKLSLDDEKTRGFGLNGNLAIDIH